MRYRQSEYKGGEWLELEKPLLGYRIVEVIYDGLMVKGSVNIKNPFHEVSWASIIPNDNKVLRVIPENEKENINPKEYWLEFK
jgi:hypothetical protein